MWVDGEDAGELLHHLAGRPAVQILQHTVVGENLHLVVREDDAEERGALAGAFALWMSTFKIARPLVRMIERMRALAQGDLEVEIDGLDRGDEVGEIANAVQVFKANAIERVRVEKEATEHRAEVEAERRRVEAEKARAAETQTQAMSQLGDGLRRLAGGDLTSRLDQRFPTEFAKIRDDFNAAASKLMETVRARGPAERV